MSKKAFDKIAAGLNEALEIARGRVKPVKLRVPPEIDVRARGGARTAAAGPGADAAPAGRRAADPGDVVVSERASPGRVIVVATGGEIAIYPIDREPALERLQEIVGGYIELVPNFDVLVGAAHPGLVGIFDNEPCVAFCNENGKLQNLPPNARATLLWKAALIRRGLPLDDYLVGHIAIFTGAKILREMRGP